MVLPWPGSAVNPILVLLLALALDRLVGEPPALWARMPHPVVAMGHLIARLDARWNPPARPGGAWVGGAILAILLILAGGGALVVALALRQVPGGWGIEAGLVAILLAGRSLADHVGAVARALAQDGLTAGRAAVAHLVGRDPAHLDARAVARAAIESLAENLADGVVAPALWYLVLGLPGLVAYKAINTADSMLGYRSPRYAAAGRWPARIDDAVNWPAARLTALLVAAAAATGRLARGRAALMTWWRDGHRAESPNAGRPMAAMAGALGLRLAGPRWYGAGYSAHAWLGHGTAAARPGHIRAALTLYRRCGCLAAGSLLGLALVAMAASPAGG